jgi:hypothetical protein
MSKLSLLATLLAVLLLLPSAAVAKAIDATKTQHLDLPDGLIGPESVAFDRHGAGPYVSISDGRILKYGGEGVGFTTFAYSPSYTKNGCGASSSELPAVAKESSCGRPLGLRFHNVSGAPPMSLELRPGLQQLRQRPHAPDRALANGSSSVARALPHACAPRRPRSRFVRQAARSARSV